MTDMTHHIEVLDKAAESLRLSGQTILELTAITAPGRSVDLAREFARRCNGHADGLLVIRELLADTDAVRLQIQDLLKDQPS